MFYLYLVLSAALIPILKNFFEIFFKKGLHFKTSRAIMNKLSVRHAVRALSSAG